MLLKCLPFCFLGTIINLYIQEVQEKNNTVPWFSGSSSMMNPLPLPLRATKKIAFVIIDSLHSTPRSLLVRVNHTDLGLWPATPLKSGLLHPQSPGTETSCFQDFEGWRSELYHKKTPILSDVASPLVSQRQFHPPTSGWPAAVAVYSNVPVLRRWGEYTAVTPFCQAWGWTLGWLRGLKERGGIFTLFMNLFVYRFLLIRWNKFCIIPRSSKTLILTVLTIVRREDIWPLLAAVTSNILRCEIFHLQGTFWVLILWFSCLNLSIADYGNVITCFACAELPYMKAD